MNLQQEIDAFLTARFEQASQYPVEKLVEKCKTANLSLTTIESALRAGCAEYEDPKAWMGFISINKLVCDYTGIEFTFYLLLPDNYRTEVATPLTVIAHGGNNNMSRERAEETALDYMYAYEDICRKGGHIIAGAATTKGWGDVGIAHTLTMIAWIRRFFHIDENRIHLTGQSMGGHLGYRMALWYSDRFGAISPHSGGYDFESQGTIINLLNTKGYAVWGETELYGINTANQANARWMSKHDKDWVFIEKKGGGHDIYPEEMENIVRFFNRFPRNLYTPQIWMKVKGKMRFEGESQVGVKPIGNRTFRCNTRSWIRLLEGGNITEFMEIYAKIEDNNIISIQTKNVKRLEVWLHPNMVNWQENVQIFINDELIFNTLPKANLKDMFSLVKEFDDRARIFWQRLEIEV